MSTKGCLTSMCPSQQTPRRSSACYRHDVLHECLGSLPCNQRKGLDTDLQHGFVSSCVKRWMRYPITSSRRRVPKARRYSVWALFTHRALLGSSALLCHAVRREAQDSLQLRASPRSQSLWRYPEGFSTARGLAADRPSSRCLLGMNGVCKDQNFRAARMPERPVSFSFSQ